MGLFGKKKITEQDVVDGFIYWTTEAVHDFWPDVYKRFQDDCVAFVKQEIVIRDEKMASFNLYLSIIAFSLIAIENLYSQDQANRLITLMIKKANPDSTKYVSDLIYTYKKDYLDAIQKKWNPFDAITVQLLKEWLDDENFKKIYFGEFVSPFLITMTTQSILHYYEGWGKINEKYTIVQ